MSSRSFAVPPQAAAFSRTVPALLVIVIFSLIPFERASAANSCINTPTVLVTDSSVGDQGTGNPSELDIQSVSVGEDYNSAGTPRLILQMKVADLNTIPANSAWRVLFNFPAGSATSQYVEMNSDATSTVTFVYGTQDTNGFNQIGNADFGSLTTDGTITITNAMSKMGGPTAGLILGGVNGETDQFLSVPGQPLFLNPADTTSSVNYTVRSQPSGCVPTPLPPFPAPQGNAPTARYQLYTPPPLSGLGLSAGEPSIGLNWKTGKAFFQSDLQTLRITFNDGSDFPTVRSLWENVSPISNVEDSDPILITDSMQGRTITSLNLEATGRAESSFSDDDGATWTPTSGSGFPAVIDHQSIGAGPFASPLTRNPTGSVFPDAVYYCSQLPTAFCSRSDDGGLTYGPGVNIYTTECGGLHGHVKVAPDGTVYVPNRSCRGNQGVVVSHDNGLTWTIRIVPGSQPENFDPSLGIGSGGRIYLGYAHSDHKPVIAVSDDQGKTWRSPLDVSGPFVINNVIFPEVTAGDNDRAAFAFLGTPTGGSYPDPNFSGVIHLYVSHTYDGGLSWRTVDVTPNAPVQRGPIWPSGGLVTYRNLLDFNDAQIDKQGRVHIAYAYGCAGAECAQAATSAKGNAYTAFSVIARQTGGLGLFAAHDTPNTPTVPGPPFVTAGRNGQTVYLGWSEADDGGSSIQSYQIYRGTTSGGESSIPIATVPASVNQYSDTTATDITVPKYYYRVIAVNAHGPSKGNNEVYAKYVGDSCAGYTVNFDPAGDQTGAPLNSDLDLLSVSVSEPPDSLKFVMKVSSLAPPNPLMPNQLLPNRRWRIVWAYPNGLSTQGQYYVGMKTDGTGTVSFDYGVVMNGTLPPVIGLIGVPTESSIGTPDSATFAPDGTITIVIAKSKVGSPQAGDLLGRVRGLTFADPSNELRSTIQIDNPSNGTANDDTANAATYVIRNPVCQ
jgi:hypothetical protein